MQPDGVGYAGDSPLKRIFPCLYKMLSYGVCSIILLLNLTRRSRDLLEEIRRSEGAEDRLAHTCGMASAPGNCIDPRRFSMRQNGVTPHPFDRVFFLFGTLAPETDGLEALQSFSRLRESISQQPAPSSIQGIRYGVDASRFWTVLIGIDAYDRRHRGCVSVALLKESFLFDDLGVSEERIQCPLGSEGPTPDESLTPSPDNIVRVLYRLIQNRDIPSGNHILIYFAERMVRAKHNCAKQSLNPICDTCPLDHDTLDAG